MGASSQHFQDSELKCRHCGVNECTQALVDALEKLRSIAISPIIVNDAYRCKVHNAAVGGVPTSEHLSGEAADIRIEGCTPAEMYDLALKVPAFAQGGIGVAEHQGYIHVDVRLRKARWTYGTDGKQAPWDSTLDEPITYA